jgi:hypothetical protein
MTAEEIWKSDAVKLNAMEKRGFHVEIAWQRESHDAVIDRVLNQIQSNA